MLKDFDNLKKQLSELAPVINSFKSESVQLRIVDLIFQGTAEPQKIEELDDGTGAKQDKRTKPISKSKKKVSSTSKETTKKAKVTGRPGPGAMVSTLLEAGYFQKHRLSADIIEHCKHKYAYTYKSDEIGTALNRALRNRKLKRDKNQESQYEYYKA